MTEDEAWQRIDAAVDPDESLRDSLVRLESLPPGYAYLFAFNYVDAEIANAGMSGLHRSSVWPLVLAATEACHAVDAAELELLLRECVYHFHCAGRSKLKSVLTDDFFVGVDTSVVRPLDELDDSWYDLESPREQVRQQLVEHTELWAAPA